jgi:signal transduction histidine kinase
MRAPDAFSRIKVGMIARLISSAKIVQGKLPESEKADLFTWRLYLALALVLYPLLGKTLLYFNPQIIDPNPGRMIIFCLTLLPLALSFTSRRVMQSLQGYILVLAWIVTAHHFYIIHLNHFTPSANFSGLILTAAVTLAFNTRRSLFLYSAYVLILSSLMIIYADPAQKTDGFIFLWGQTALLFVQGVATLIRIAMIDALKTVETKDFTQRWLKNDYISKMASLGRMSSGVAHEINNPLSIILGLAAQVSEIAASDAGLKKEHLIKSMGTIEKSAQRIGKVVNSMRSFSKDSFQSTQLKTHMKEIIDEATSLCQARVRRSNVELIISDYHPELVVECQRTQISHVILCLITNALDAVEKTESPWIKIEVKDNDSHVEVSVTDSGPGLSKESAGKLFEAFYTTKEKGKAMGLSLNISKRWVEEHEGHLVLDAQSKNTRFVMTLPNKKEKKLALPLPA